MAEKQTYLMTVMGRYDGKLTLWTPFLALEDQRTDNAECAVVSEDNYVRLHDQLQGAVEAFKALRWNVADGHDAQSAVIVERESFEALRRALTGGQ
jgi:6-phosphofructokinase